MKFSENLIDLRRKMGLSQEELGEKVGVARQTISKWENGETTPDAYTLMELSKIFEISIDELVGNSSYSEKKIKKKYYEYVSKTKVGKVPLVHINHSCEFGHVRTAKGIVAVGNIATGVFAFGGVAIGLFTLGGISLGLISLGGIAIALLLSIGGISIGSMAIGSIAIGFLALGGVALGVYSIGGFALASRIAGGGYAVGHIAIGEEADGVVKILLRNHPTSKEISNIILKEFPKTWGIIVKIFSHLN